MNYKDLIPQEPHTLTILPTHRCTASCDNCCFGCTPQIQHIMPYEEIKYHIDESLKHFSSIQVLVLSGGECFLLGEELNKVIQYATDLGLITRVVSNGYWATSYDEAFRRLYVLKKCGLKEFNLSTGDDHQKFVRFQNIKYAVQAALDIGISPVIIALEDHANSKFTIQNIKQDEFISSCIEKRTVEVLIGSWIRFKKEDKNSINQEQNEVNKINIVSEEGCSNLFCGITINPYSQSLACCGLTVEYNDFLKLGSLRKYSIKDLYKLQFEDLYKIWLFTLGPKQLYEKIMIAQGKSPQKFNHACAYCIEAVKDEVNLETIKELLPKELPNIVYKLKLANKLKNNASLNLSAHEKE